MSLSLHPLAHAATLLAALILLASCGDNAPTLTASPHPTKGHENTIPSRDRKEAATDISASVHLPTRPIADQCFSTECPWPRWVTEGDEITLNPLPRDQPRRVFSTERSFEFCAGN